MRATDSPVARSADCLRRKCDALAASKARASSSECPLELASTAAATLPSASMSTVTTATPSSPRLHASIVYRGGCTPSSSQTSAPLLSSSLTGAVQLSTSRGVIQSRNDRASMESISMFWSNAQRCPATASRASDCRSEAWSHPLSRQLRTPCHAGGPPAHALPHQCRHRYPPTPGRHRILPHTPQAEPAIPPLCQIHISTFLRVPSTRFSLAVRLDGNRMILSPFPYCTPELLHAEKK